MGEEIFIGANIRLKVLAIHGKHVRLGLSAPASTPIRRAELGTASLLADDPETPSGDAAPTAVAEGSLAPAVR
jgi:carbon storage regulator CsrA